MGGQALLGPPEFKEWAPIARLYREIVITEKIDGTNGVVYVNDDGSTVLAGPAGTRKG